MYSPNSAVMAGLVPAIHVSEMSKEVVDARGKPGHDECGAYLVLCDQAASTSTSSESSSAVIVSCASSRIAAPSRALTRTPLTSTAPAAGTR